MSDVASVVYLVEPTRGNEKPTAAAVGKASAKPDSSDATENPTPTKLFTMNRVKPFAEGASVLFQGKLFAAVAWNAKQDGGVGIETEAGGKGDSRLVLLDLARETSRVLGMLEGFAGGLRNSPFGGEAALLVGK